MSGRARIKDVAILAGNSFSTVSNYLNERPHRMAADAVVRIESAIETLSCRRTNPFHGAIARYIEEGR